MIPSAKPYLSNEEAGAVAEVISSGWVTQGPKVKEFEEAFSSYVGASHAVAVSNCTTAIHLALLAANVKPGDVVITVSHSFIATANTIRHCMAEPVFVDIDPVTYNISLADLKRVLENDCREQSGALIYKHVDKLLKDPSPLRLLSKDKVTLGRVAAIMVVHQMGMPCDIEGVTKLAKKYELPVIEDAACAIGSEYKGQKIGKPHSDLVCFSFHPLKVLTTGEGGMITTNNSEYEKNMRLLRHQGMSVSDVLRHEAKEVIIEEYPVVGYNYRMTDIQAAIGLIQLKKLPGIIKRRKSIAGSYQEKLKDIGWLRLPEESDYASSNWQSFCVEVLKDAPMKRNQLMQYLRDQGVLTRLGIMNAHSERPYNGVKWNLPHSEYMRDNALILPLFVSMTDEEQNKVINILKKTS